MKNLRRFRGRLAALIPALLAFAVFSTAANAGTVVEMEIDGGIGPATVEYVTTGLARADEVNAEFVLLRMDTPGGLLESTREIVTAILNSDVPVVTYIDPPGSRAASAGTFILLASHVAAMAPTTNVGAATPINVTGDDIGPEPPGPPERPENPLGDPLPEADPDVLPEEDEAGEQDAPAAGSALERKIMNDTITYIRNLADRHGRNADWAERAVVDADVLSEQEALEQNVIDFVAANRDDLFAQIDGHEVQIGTETVTISATDLTVEEFSPSWRIRLLTVLQNPQVFLLLGAIGFYGIVMELWNPGALVPGVVGAICLILALYAGQTLPINYAGVALVLLGLGLMVAEAFAPSFGVLGLGGIAAFVFGTIMMFDTGVPGFGISYSFVIGLGVFLALLMFWLASFTLRLHRRGAVYGEEAIVGAAAVAVEDFVDGEGKVWLEGEAWAAHSSVPIAKDQDVLVTDLQGLTLEVKPVGATARAQTAT